MLISVITAKMALCIAKKGKNIFGRGKIEGIKSILKQEIERKSRRYDSRFIGRKN